MRSSTTVIDFGSAGRRLLAHQFSSLTSRQKIDRLRHSHSADGTSPDEISVN